MSRSAWDVAFLAMCTVTMLAGPYEWIRLVAVVMAGFYLGKLWERIL